MSKRTEQQSTTVSPYTLTLPAQFDLKPLHTVELPDKCVAMIFDDEQPSGYGDKPPIKGWRIIYRTSKGAQPRALNGDAYSRRGNAFFDNPLDVRIAIEAAARALAPKVTKMRVEENAEDDDMA